MSAHQQRAQELKLLAQAASAAAEGADAFALLETLKPLRKPVASAAALGDHAQLGSLEKAAEAAAANAEACLLRLAGARAAVADAVACLSPADVANAVKEGALPGLAERDAAQIEAGQLLPSAISAYVALAALHAERAELQTHLEGAAASEEGEEESVSVSEAVLSLSALDNALARVQTAQHTARAMGEPTQPAAAAAPVQYPQFAAMPKAVPFSPRGSGEVAALQAALAAAAIPRPQPRTAKRPAAGEGTAKRPAFAAGSASMAGQEAAAADQSKAAWIAQGAQMQAQALVEQHVDAWREYYARQPSGAVVYHPGRDGNADSFEWFHSITAHPAYSAHSFEELRLEHYQQREHYHGQLTGNHTSVDAATGHAGCLADRQLPQARGQPQPNHTVNACFSPEQRAVSSHNLQQPFALRPVDGATNLRRYTAALNAEADALAALSAAAASAVFQCRAALRQAVSKCQVETPAEDAAAAASIAMRFRGALRTLSLELASRDGVAATRQELQEASSSRVAALVELVELESERSKRQIQASWFDVAETKFKAAAAALRERVAQAEARWAALERSVLRAPLVARCFPEIAATVAAETAAASIFTSSLSSGKQLCAADFEELEILHKTPSRSVLRARRTHAPSAPDACLKVFLAADVGAFPSEARHLAALASHPLIVRYEGAYTDNAGRGVLVMPFYPAGSIRPWVDEMRAKHSAGGLSSEDWASVRRTFRQLASALAYIHSKRVAHRDLKPENVLWADPSRRTIALSDFGLSRDLSAALETTRAIGATVTYAAPEACTPAWKVSPWAGDIWSLGAMALEVVTGKLYGLSGRRLECVATGASYSTPQGGGAAAQDAVELALAMLREAPGERPTADEVLLHPFFASSDAAMADAAGPGLGVGDGAAPALAAKLSAIVMLSSRTRGGAAWRLQLPARSDGAAAPAASAAWWNALLEAVGGAPAHALASTWNAFEAGVHVPLSACLRTFWACAPHARGFLEQCETASRAPGAPPALDLPFLPVRYGGSAPTAAFSALGRLLARCMLDGMAVSVELAPVAFAVLLGRG